MTMPEEDLMVSVLRFLASLFSIFCLCVFVASCSPGTKAESKVDPVPVAIGNVRHSECNQTIFVSGSVVSPDAPSTLTFLVSGKVLFVGPREGDYVKRGQRMAEVDPLDYRLRSRRLRLRWNRRRWDYGGPRKNTEE